MDDETDAFIESQTMPTAAASHKSSITTARRHILLLCREADKRRVYSSSRWQRLRLWKLREQPLCVACLHAGRTVPAKDVDHIREHSGLNDPLAWDSDNLQSLCHSCHSSKTGRKRVRNGW